VHIAALVRVLQSEADLIDDRDSGAFAIAIEGPLGGQVVQISLSERHDEPGRVVGSVEQGHHVGVVEVPEYLDLSGHARQRVCVALRPFEGEYGARAIARASPKDLRIAAFA